MVIFNPLNKEYKSIIGAIKENTLITFRLRCSCDIVDLVFYNDDGLVKKFSMQKENETFFVNVSLEKGLYFYYFDLKNGSFVGENSEHLGEITNSPKSFQLSVYSADYEVPEFLNGGIIYQIFPDRFYRAESEKIIEKGKILHDKWDELPIFLPDKTGEILNNDFFGGDLKGIEEKLDYLKSLSVSIIYLNPIFKAYSNHRYDTADYMSIDPLLGTEEDLKHLILEANKKNIKIILDGVFNHTGSDSIYFNKDKHFDSLGAYNSKESKYYSWYNFKNFPNDYSSWWGIKTLPATNKESGYVDFITGQNGVLEHYTKLGIMGWRLDVVDELPESFSEKIRTAVKNVNKDAVIIGEVWEDASNKISYGKRRKYFLGKELDSVMNYPLKNAIIEYAKFGNSRALSLVIKEQIDHYPKKSLEILMNILATHDIFRLISALSDVDVRGLTKEQQSKIILNDYEYKVAVERLKIAVLLQYTLYGIPSIYYGDEIGMQGFSDPLNRGTFSWERIDKNIYDFYVKMGKIRSISAFSKGETEVIKEDNGFFAYTRKDENSEVLVLINLSHNDFELNFNGKLKDLLSENCFENKNMKSIQTYLEDHHSHDVEVKCIDCMEYVSKTINIESPITTSTACQALK